MKIDRTMVDISDVVFPGRTGSLMPDYSAANKKAERDVLSKEKEADRERLERYAKLHLKQFA